tara:strand:+ start:341 stop:1321 length:981 start_codon:yes stop_codon:yes gene_type:complete
MDVYIPSPNEIFQVLIENISALFTDLSLPQAVLYLVSTYVIGYLFYIIISKKRPSDFIRDAFSREIWLSDTAAVDFSFFFLFIVGISTGFVFGIDIVPQAIEYLKISFFPDGVSVGIFPSFSENVPFMIAWTLVLVVITDFLHFFIHWIEHKFRFFWFFHSTHHSANHLNPFVAYRLHPVELFLVRLIRLALAPAIFAILTFYLFGTQAITYVFYGVPIYFFVYYLYSNLRHTEVWIKFPRKLSYIFCSPAMHQIHHSDDPNWYGTNMSFLFSLWDWMFGTIYVPTDKDREILSFGLQKKENVPAGSFIANIINPFTNIYRWILNK